MFLNLFRGLISKVMRRNTSLPNSTSYFTEVNPEIRFSNFIKAGKLKKQFEEILGTSSEKC